MTLFIKNECLPVENDSGPIIGSSRCNDAEQLVESGIVGRPDQGFTDCCLSLIELAGFDLCIGKLTLVN